MSEVRLRAHDLSVGHAGHSVLTGVELHATTGQSLALVGTNGSGKSTLLKTIVGLLRPLGGSLEVIGGRPGDDPRRLGYLGQFHTAGTGLLPLQARDVVLMARYPRRGLVGRITRGDREAVADAMERMHVAHLATRPLHALSGGQARRVHLAQALARQADLLVLDEPTAGLDASSTTRYQLAVQEEIARGATVVVATHDLADAARFQRVLLLAHGCVRVGSPRQVMNTDNLLDAFGIALHAVDHSDHQDLLSPQVPHHHA